MKFIELPFHSGEFGPSRLQDKGFIRSGHLWPMAVPSIAASTFTSAPLLLRETDPPCLKFIHMNFCAAVTLTSIYTLFDGLFGNLPILAKALPNSLVQNTKFL